MRCSVTPERVFSGAAPETKGEPLHFRSQKAASLIAFLSFHRNAHRRELLAETFWPEVPLDKARGSLRVTLNGLRDLLGADAIENVGGGRELLRLAPAALTDVEAFRALCKIAENSDQPEPLWAQALEIASAPFGRGLYDEWVAAEAARLEDEVFCVALKLIETREASGNLLGALDAARRGATYAPARVGAMREVVRLSRKCGQTESVRREVQAWRHRLEVQGLEAPGADDLLQQLDNNGASGAPLAAKAPTAQEEKTEHSPAAALNRVRRQAGASFDAKSENDATQASAFLARLEIKPLPIPISVTTFIGREADVAFLESLLSTPATRLITILGAGGAGKTRLAAEIAQRARREPLEALDAPWKFVAWVELANLASSRLLVGALRDALGFSGTRDDVAALAAGISSVLESNERALLVFDNCEHLLHGVAQLGTELLQQTPGLTVLTTSRAPLRVPGEQLYALQPLAICAPASDKNTTASHAFRPNAQSEVATTADASTATFSLTKTPGEPHDRTHGGTYGEPHDRTYGGTYGAAVELFVQRARLARPDFSPDAYVVEIKQLCELLGGLPLAIEVAAARSALFSPSQILAQIIKARRDAGTAPELEWTNPHRDAPARHRTLGAAIEWSVNQLSPAAAQMWSALSVFRGGASVEAAQFVCSEFVAAGEVERIFNELADYSLLRLQADDGSHGALHGAPHAAPRALWLEPLREFATRSLSNDARVQLQRCHATFFETLAREQIRELDSSNAECARAILLREHDNLRVAVKRMIELDPLQALRLSATLWWFWESADYVGEGLDTLETVLQRTQHQADAPELQHWRAWAHEGLGKLANLALDSARAVPHLETALAIYRELGDEAGASHTLYALGFNAMQRGDLDEARRLCEESLALSRVTGPDHLHESLYNLSLVALMAGDLTAAREMSLERLRHHRKHGKKRGIALALEHLGSVSLFEGQLEAAHAYFEQAFDVFSAIGEAPAIARALWGLGTVARLSGDGNAARRYFGRALDLSLRAQHEWSLPFLFESFGFLAEARGDFERASRLMAGAHTMREAAGEVIPAQAMRDEWQAHHDTLEQALGAGRFQTQWTIGSTLLREELLALARAEAWFAQDETQDETSGATQN